MNGESKRSYVLALASFVIGALVAGLFGNKKTRALVAEGSKNFVRRTKRLGKRTAHP